MRKEAVYSYSKNEAFVSIFNEQILLYPFVRSSILTETSLGAAEMKWITNID